MRRLFAYAPGEALVIVDWIRAAGLRGVERRFQLAVGLDCSVEGDAARVTRDGHVVAWCVTPGTAPKLEFAENDPLAGHAFPELDQRVPRVALSFESDPVALAGTAFTFGERAPAPEIQVDRDGRVRFEGIAGLDGICIWTDGRSLRRIA